MYGLPAMYKPSQLSVDSYSCLIMRMKIWDRKSDIQVPNILHRHNLPIFTTLFGSKGVALPLRDCHIFILNLRK